MGYDIITGVRFGIHGGRPSFKLATVEVDGLPIAKLNYGNTATLWRINLGFRRRADKNVRGFMLDTERGYWARNEQNPEDEDDSMSDAVKRVVPFVTDHRNALLIEPCVKLEMEVMASLQAALKHAIQVEFELEDNELAVEPLPGRDPRNLILIYESAEGGAGVLRQLLDGDAFARVCRRALDICHFDPETGADLGKAPRSKENCEAACYDCLMTYGNQPDHQHLDRKKIRDLLLEFTKARVASAPASIPRVEHLDNLLRRADSELERDWLHLLEAHDLRLPSDGQKFFDQCQTRPDFYYHEAKTVIYIDGPPHDYPERHQRDSIRTECMENAGYIVIRFNHRERWLDIINQFPSVFGKET